MLGGFRYDDYEETPYKSALFIGKSGGGKSLTCLHYLKRYCRHIGSYIAVTGSPGAYDHWVKALGSPAFVYDAGSIEDIQQLQDLINRQCEKIALRKHQGLRIRTRDKLTVIFDDTNDEKELEKSKIVPRMYTKGRQGCMMPVYLTQTVKNRSSVPPVVRDNSNIVFTVYSGEPMLRQVRDIFVTEIDSDVFVGICNTTFALKDNDDNLLYASIVINRTVRSTDYYDILSVYVPERKEVIENFILNDPAVVEAVSQKYINLEEQKIQQLAEEKERLKRIRESKENNPFNTTLEKSTIHVKSKRANRPDVTIRLDPEVFRRQRYYQSDEEDDDDEYSSLMGSRYESQYNDDNDNDDNQSRLGSLSELLGAF